MLVVKKIFGQILLKLTQKIKIVLVFVVANICSSFIVKPKCNLLPDGLYKMEFTRNSNETASLVKIICDSFIQYGVKHGTINGKIKWTYDCTFILDYDKKQVDTSYFGHLLSKSFGKNCIELDKASGDTVFFRTTYTGNLHITINEGRFVRQK